MSKLAKIFSRLVAFALVVKVCVAHYENVILDRGELVRLSQIRAETSKLDLDRKCEAFEVELRQILSSKVGPIESRVELFAAMISILGNRKLPFNNDQPIVSVLEACMSEQSHGADAFKREVIAGPSSSRMQESISENSSGQGSMREAVGEFQEVRNNVKDFGKDLYHQVADNSIVHGQEADHHNEHQSEQHLEHHGHERGHFSGGSLADHQDEHIDHVEQHSIDGHPSIDDEHQLNDNGGHSYSEDESKHLDVTTDGSRRYPYTSVNQHFGDSSALPSLGPNTILDDHDHYVASKETELRALENENSVKQEEINSLNEKIHTLKVEFDMMKEQYEQAARREETTEKLLTGTRAEVAEKDKSLTAARTELAGKDESLTAARTELAEKDKSLTAARTELAGKDELLTGARAEVAEKDKLLTAARTELAGKDELLTGARAEVAEKDKSLTAARTELAGKDESLTAARTELAEKDKSLTAARTELAGKDELLTGARAEVAEKDKLLTAARTELAEKDKLLTGARAEVAEKDRLLQVLIEKDEKHHRHQDVHHDHDEDDKDDKYHDDDADDFTYVDVANILQDEMSSDEPLEHRCFKYYLAIDANQATDREKAERIGKTKVSKVWKQYRMNNVKMMQELSDHLIGMGKKRSIKAGKEIQACLSSFYL